MKNKTEFEEVITSFFYPFVELLANRFEIILDNKLQSGSTNTDSFLTVDDLCKKFNVSASTVRNWSKKGTLNPICLPGSRKVWYSLKQIEDLTVPIQKYQHRVFVA